MKKLIKNLVFAMSVSLLFISCSNDETEVAVETLNAQKDANKIAEILNSGAQGIPFPEGSKVFKISEDEFEIRLPEDVFFLVSVLESNNNKSNISLEIADISVTCTCSKGKGCSPVKVKGEYYCVMNRGCSTCSMSVSTTGKKQNITILGIIDYSAGVSFISEVKSPLTSPQDKIISKTSSEQFLNKPEVKKALLEFYSVIYDNKIPNFILENQDAPQGYSYSKVNLFGNEIMIPVKSNSISKSLRIASIEEASAVSCTCAKGKGSGCVKKSFMGAKYCDAGSCTVCTLSE
ncbi:hypothetical protein [Flavobacterium sp.]|jgi:hypothetical protein|uniref:hypothetical protein n=1 Tax=Flavobacterium sp. TaxID=239 RepID=UPI0037BEE5E7